MGNVTDKLEPLIIKLANRFDSLSPLKDRREREVAGGHLVLHAALNLLCCFIALFHMKLLVLLVLPAYLFVYFEERVNGRKIDWITRTVGWGLGTLFIVPVLIWG